MRRRGPRHLRILLVGSFLGIAVLPPAILGAIALAVAEPHLRAGVAARNQQIASAVAGEVTRYLEGHLMVLQALAVAGAPNEPALAAALRASPAIQSIVVLDQQGTAAQAAPPDPDVLGTDFSGQPFVREAWSRGAPTWSSAVFSPSSGRPGVTVVVPAGGLTVVGYLDLEALTAIVERTHAGLGGEAAVVDRDGTLIALPRPQPVREQVNVGDLELVRQGLAGAERTAVFRFLGEERLGSASRVPSSGWLVLVTEPVERAYGEVRRIRGLVLGVFGGTSFLAIAVGLLSARRILRPLAALTAGTRRIAAGGDYSAVLAGERLHFVELAQLADSFDRMAHAVREREMQLARSERSYRRLVDTPLAGVARVDEQGRIELCNDALARLAGRGSHQELVGTLFEELVASPEARQRLREGVAGQGRAINLESPIARPSGEQRLVLLSAARDEVALTAVVLDVTDLKRAAAEREQLEQQLFHAQRVEAVGRLAGGVAHDFNNILTAILGFADQILEVSRDKAVRECAAGVQEAGWRAAALTRSLLAFGRKQVLERLPLDLRDMVRDVATMIRRVIGEDVYLAVSLPEAPLAVVADRGQLEQVLVNLCTNARDATPAGGEIRVVAAAAALDEAAARAAGLPRGGPWIQLSVEDQGHGMTGEVLDHIFEPFFTTKARDKGTGLGLAIVHGIVRQHEGHIAVASTPGAGSRFTIYLPPAPAAAAGPPAGTRSGRTPALAPRGGGETVLVAEDEPAVLAAVSRTLEGAGYVVLRARNGEEAVRAFEEAGERVALCLLDGVMPRMSGVEASEIIRRIRPTVPVLLLSGHAADVLDGRGLAEAGLGLLTKPIASAELLARVRREIETARGAPALLAARASLDPEEG